MEILETIPCYTIYCGEDWKSHQKKMFVENNSCVESFHTNSSNRINEINIISDIVHQTTIIK